MRVGKMSPAMAKALEIADQHVADNPPVYVEPVVTRKQVEEDPLKIPDEFRRDPNADALKKMNERIEKRAGQRRKEKPVKSPLLAKAIADNNRRNSPKT
jgi:hypothetical protein